MILAEFSGLILSLYRTARETSVHDFQSQVITQLRTHIDFDAAWWGVCGKIGNRIVIFQSFFYNLPATFYTEWSAISAHDHLAYAVTSNPGVTILATDEASDADDIGRFIQHHAIQSALSTLLPASSSGLGLFLSLYRSVGVASFNEDERAFVQVTTPHLMESWQDNWRRSITQDLIEKQTLGAVVDPGGVLIDAGTSFCQRILLEWPHWTGGRLPQPVYNLVVARSGQFRGKHIELLVSDAHPNGTIGLSCTPRLVPLLSNREESVAREYAAGLSYKEIAKKLHLSPTTVRSYLRDCYLKLGVSNKCALGRTFGM